MPGIQPLYTNLVDRYRLIEVLYRSEYDRVIQAGKIKNQEQLGVDAGLSQSSVSLVGNVSQSVLSANWIDRLKRLSPYPLAADPLSKPVRRLFLLRVFGKGLKSSLKIINAALWLFDSEPLRTDELEFVEHIPDAQPQSFTRDELIDMTRQLIEEAIRASKKAPQYESYFSQDQESIHTWFDFMLGHQPLEGETRYMSSFPPIFLMEPSDLEHFGQSRTHPLDQDPHHKEVLTQKALMLQKLTIEGIKHGAAPWRTILPIDTLNGFLNNCPKEYYKARKNVVKNALQLLTNPDYHFHLVLSDIEPVEEIYVKSTRWTMTGSSGSRCVFAEVLSPCNLKKPTTRIVQGDIYRKFQDLRNVLRYYDLFEKEWFQVLGTFRVGKHKEATYEELEILAKKDTIKALEQILGDAKQ